MLGVSELDGFEFSHGSFFPPTILTDISTEDELWKEEIFGPVVVIRRFSVRITVQHSNVANNRFRAKPKVWRLLMTVSMG